MSSDLQFTIPIRTLREDDVVNTTFFPLSRGTHLRFLPVTIHAEELHRRSVRKSALQWV